MTSVVDIGWSYLNEGATTSWPLIPQRIYTSIPAHGVPHTIQYLDFEGQLVTESLNPPEMNVIRHSLFQLVASTQRMNQTHLSPNAPMLLFQQNVDGHLSELIKVACQALIREADIQSSDIRRKHDINAAAFRRQRDAQAAQLAHLQNTLAPINNLPVEVLSHILLFASLDGWGPLSHTEAIKTLATVGKYWSRVVFSTPQIWSTLEDTMSRKELEVAIQRSKRTPLHIHFKGPAQYSFARKSFVELIMPHMARWKTLIGENVPQSVIEGLESGAPSLLNLQLKSSTGPQMVFTAMQTVSQTASPALGDGARLVSLDLTAIGMSWTSARLQGLKHLALFTLYGEKAPNIADMVYILAHSPHLEVLILHDVAFTPSQASLGIQQNMETLTPFLSLQRLQLTMIPSRYYYHLLTHLRFPNCKSIDLAPNPPLNPVEDDQVTYRHNTPLFAQQIRSMLLCDGDGPVQVGLGYLGDPKTFHLSTFGRRVYPMNIPRQPDRPGFSLRLRPPTTMDEMGSLEVVQEVIELVLQACPASALHLSICLTSTVPQFPIECLARLNNTNSVEELSVSGSADVRSILQYIAQRREPLTTTSERELFSTWLFPQLKTISLAASSCNNSVVAIRDWAKERWMKSNTKWPRPEGSVEVTMPSRKGGRQEFWKPVVRRRVTGRQAVAELEDGEDEDES